MLMVYPTYLHCSHRWYGLTKINVITGLVAIASSLVWNDILFENTGSSLLDHVSSIFEER